MRKKDEEFKDKLFLVVDGGMDYAVKGFSGKIWVTGSRSTCYRWLKSIFCQFTAAPSEQEYRDAYRKTYDADGYRLPRKF